MIDISAIDKYLDEPDSFMKNFVPHEISNVGLFNVIEYDFNKLDVSRTSANGIRPMQTIAYPYRRTITELVYIINNYVSIDERDAIFTRLLELHDKNIEYEKVNPPVWYGTEKERRKYEQTYEKKSSSPKPKRAKQQKIEFAEEHKEPTAAEKKLAARVAKINALSFKIKPQN